MSDPSTGITLRTIHRMHGGQSTGPRTAAGLARMVAAKTTHGSYAMSGAAKRLAQLYVRTLIVRTRLVCTATRLRAYLPAGMAARLDAAPEALKAPKHPSQVAFEALHAATPCNCLPPGLGAGRRARAARARRGAGDGVADGTAAVLRGRETERAAAQAPWRAAIAAARGLKRAAWEARRETRSSRNDPMRGMALGARVAAGAALEAPLVVPAGQRAGDSAGRAVGPRGVGEALARRAERQTRDPRNDPIRGAALGAGVAAADASLEVPAGQHAGDTAGWTAGSPGLGEALAREVMARRLCAELALRGNNPMRGPAASAGAGDGARVAQDVPPLGSTRALALGSTKLART
jgi:hypothetical protein